MSTKIFVNLPVKNLNKAMDFFKAIGYTFNKQFTDETAACMVISEDIYAMLLTEEKFKGFTTKSLCDTSKSIEGSLCLSCDTRAQVDDIVNKAMAAGATTHVPSKDYGFMYQNGFQDLDGHIWEFVWMDPSFIQPT